VAQRYNKKILHRSFEEGDRVETGNSSANSGQGNSHNQNHRLCTKDNIRERTTKNFYCRISQGILQLIEYKQSNLTRALFFQYVDGFFGEKDIST
jgi:hypothetical protein